MSGSQIYSATYSNVPVFEFVTDEGPIMRRKKDSWINATHILKIAKFPKAKRTRILEKDVQTGIHEKVQGGYGKYQGTYVPLDLGIELARNFNVYDVLKPIFEFKYIEGKSNTPPPAPKHNHASASNVANRTNSSGDLVQARKNKSTTSSLNEPPRKRGRPKRVTLAQPPTLSHSDTQPIPGSIKLTRQDTEQDALNLMASNMNHHIQSHLGTPQSQQGHRIRPPVKEEDLELDNSSDNDEEEEFLTGKELFGTPRNSFERIVNNHNNHNASFRSQNHLQQQFSGIPGSAGNLNMVAAGFSRNNSHDPYGLSQYHHPHQNNQLQSFKDDPHNEYFTNLLNFFLEDNQQGASQRSSAEVEDEEKDTKLSKRAKDTVIPAHLLNPPQPIAKININQPIDNDGNTIFHWACSMGNYTIIEFLLSNFPNIINSNLKNNNGETPLMFLVKFSNSYQLKNFPSLLDLLVDSLFSVDNYNKTVLHHIALSVAPPSNFNERSFVGNEESQLNNYLKNKERIARYYIECLFSKIIEFQEYKNNDTSNDLIKKFINHQDSDGNTAFHLVAYNLNKKLIKVFISYHRFIDFHLKNLVNYSAEEYLASHNYILKLENEEPIRINDALAQKSVNIQSFESQLYYSKMTVNLANSTSNLITEKLTELNFLIDKELNEKDEKLLKLINLNNKFQTFKLLEQKLILKIFKLDYLIKDVEADLELMDLKRDKIIQDEINRFVNDLTFQVLQKKEKLEAKMGLYKSAYLKYLKADLKTEPMEQEEDSIETDDKFELAAILQKEIIRCNQMLDKVIDLQATTTGTLNRDAEGNKENNQTNGENNGRNENGGLVAGDDKLNKYCKLVSLCCGMDVSEVEGSIDSIEQSLMKSLNQK